MKKICLVIGLLCLFILVPILVGFVRAEKYENSNNSTNISVYNTWSVGTLLELKCDFNNDIKNYKLYRRIFIPKKSNKTISLPNSLKNCEIWVIKIIFW